MAEVYRCAIMEMLGKISDEGFLRKIYTILKEHEKRRG